jgi:hypothetical protein
MLFAPYYFTATPHSRSMIFANDLMQAWTIPVQ